LGRSKRGKKSKKGKPKKPIVEKDSQSEIEEEIEIEEKKERKSSSKGRKRSKKQKVKVVVEEEEETSPEMDRIENSEEEIEPAPPQEEHEEEDQVVEDASSEVEEEKEEVIEEKIERSPPEEKDEEEDVWEDEGNIIVEESEEGEDVWEAVEEEDVLPKSGLGAVFDDTSMQEVLKEVIEQAWQDGVITEDEMAMLRVLKDKLNIDDQTFGRIITETTPTTPKLEVEKEITIPNIPESYDEDEDLEDDEEEDEEDDEIELEIPYVIKPPPDMPTDLPTPPPKPDFSEIPEPTPFETPSIEDFSEIPEPVSFKPPPKPKEAQRSIITLTSSVRSKKKPLDESFDLSKRADDESAIKKRCPHCRAMIRVRLEDGKNTCPICGGRVVKEKMETPGLRKILDQAKTAFKEGDRNTSLELYSIALAQSPDNKEAQFYLQKLHHHKIKKVPIHHGDARNVSYIQTQITRLDQLLHGGLPSGSQVLLKGPAFCGKEVLFDKIMASTLSHGIPVIYVSSNRAMKEVMRGIIVQVPDFKSFNKEGLVRMYDLFTKHSDGRILKEGHRIFNIEDRDDFKRFQTDLVFLMEELVQQYHGGVMILNSLSPLINQTDQNDLMKFLQVLIARSKSYRFTNIMDMATGVHPENMENSVEYLMDGILEFKENENRSSLRLRGFRHGVLTRDWVEYKHSDSDLKLVGSFQEERII
jgi:KaiC/GvpD/RAD55 family RecA-like ATPase